MLLNKRRDIIDIINRIKKINGQSLYRPLLFLIFVCIIGGCGPGLDEESVKWERNLGKIEEYKRLYPDFKPPLEKLLSEARKEWEKAHTIKDPEKRAESLEKANKTLDTDFTRDLGAIKGKLTDILKKQKELQALKGLSLENRKAVRRKIQETRVSVTEVRQLIFSGEPQDEEIELAGDTVGEALEKLDNAWTKLDQWQKALVSEKKSVEGQP